MPRDLKDVFIPPSFVLITEFTLIRFNYYRGTSCCPNTNNQQVSHILTQDLKLIKDIWEPCDEPPNEVYNQH